MPAAKPLNMASLEDFTTSVVSAFNNSLEGEGGHKLDADSDFFEAGMDSLQVLTLSRALKAGIASSNIDADESKVAPRAFYANRNARSLCKALYSPAAANAEPVSALDEMEAIIKKCGMIRSLAPLPTIS